MTTPPTHSGAAYGQETEEKQDILYRFPYSSAAVELLPDHRDAFRLRLAWLRGKSGKTVFESTAFRPLAEVTLRGQTFPAYLTQHSRKRRDRIVLGGKRKTGPAARATLRFLAYVEGREDTLVWTWRIGATSVAMATAPLSDLPDTVRVRLPFLPGQPRVFTLSLGEGRRALAVWSKELVTTFVSRSDALSPQVRDNAAELVLENAPLGGDGTTLVWETRLGSAKSEADVQQALRRHAAQVADSRQEPCDGASASLWELSTVAARGLMSDTRVRKRGVDRLMYLDHDGRAVAGEGVETARAACALLGRYYLTGDDALRRRARLLGRGLCDFQISQESSSQWGALWDAQSDRSRFEDFQGGPTLSTKVAARAATGLHVLHAHFQTELLARTALAASQWLLLRMDHDGLLQGERFHETGPALPHVSPWATGEALIALVETFRRTRNETFLRAALRTIGALEEGIELGTLCPEVASTEQLAATIEGILLVSREYESERMIRLAREIGFLLRARRLPGGALGDPLHPAETLEPTLAAVAAALALARVDPDPLWLTLALRALRATEPHLGAIPERLPLATLGQLTRLPLELLVSVGALGSRCQADREKLSVIRQWQTFAPEPAAWDYVQVTGPSGEPLDFLPLVCPTTLQVLIPVIAPPGTKEVRIVKNNREPMVRNLLTGELDTRAELIPLGDGRDAWVGVFLADT